MVKQSQDVALAVFLCCATLTPIHAQTSGKASSPTPGTTTTQSPTEPSEEAKKSCGVVGQTYICVP